MATAHQQAEAHRFERDKLEQDMAMFDAKMRQALDQTVEEGDALKLGVTDLEGRLDDAINARHEVTKQLAQLEIQLADVTASRDNTSTTVTKLEGELTALRIDLSDAENMFAGLSQHVDHLNHANGLLLAETDQLRKKTSWIAQVLGYHRGYAGTVRKVEVSVKEERDEQALSKWLGSTFGHAFSIPELEGFSFIGGRVFFVNGVPTGQIAYHDAEGHLTDFCFTHAPEGRGSCDIPKRRIGDSIIVTTLSG